MKLRVSKAAVASIAICLPLTLFAWGCSPQAASDQGGDAKATNMAEATWSPDIDCLSCHVDEAASSADAKCLAGQHTTAQSFDCITCHTDEALADVHQNMNSGNMPKKLKKTSVDQVMCQSCHSQADLTQKTSASTARQ